MTWRTLATLIALGVSVSACDKIPFLSKKAPDTTKTAVDTTHPAQQPAAQAPAPTPAPEPKPKPMQVAAAPLHDQPWTPVDTGTIDPGMSHDQVVATWGVPVAERHQGSWTYLYFRNGCEVSCGTFDVVFLDSGSVVDAIVRGPGHHYSGVSSSPAERKPEPTKPDSTGAGAAGLTMP